MFADGFDHIRAAPLAEGPGELAREMKIAHEAALRQAFA